MNRLHHAVAAGAGDSYFFVAVRTWNDNSRLHYSHCHAAEVDHHCCQHLKMVMMKVIDFWKERKMPKGKGEEQLRTGGYAVAVARIVDNSDNM